jgi:hypothetical protein
MRWRSGAAPCSRINSVGASYASALMEEEKTALLSSGDRGVTRPPEKIREKAADENTRTRTCTSFSRTGLVGICYTSSPVHTNTPKHFCVAHTLLDAHLVAGRNRRNVYWRSYKHIVACITL